MRSRQFGNYLRLIMLSATLFVLLLLAEPLSTLAGYQVFVTPHSAATAGLAVINDTAGSFEVVELGKGQGNFKFDWRISAIRKGYTKTRLEDAPVVAPAATEPDVPRLDRSK